MRAVAAKAKFKDGAEVWGTVVLYRKAAGHPEEIATFVAQDGTLFKHDDYESCACEPAYGCFDLSAQ